MRHAGLSLMVSASLLGCSGHYRLGAAASGGTAATGGVVASAGEPARGGEPSGGFSAGGLANGGVPAGGAPSGGLARGGEPSGGFPAGGLANGGVPAGGAPSGGLASGGEPSGGFPAGGLANGGVPAGGAPSGGTAAGGLSAGGSGGSGAAAVSVCATVATLPVIGSSCSTTGESRCTASGRCVCANGIWYCNTICASTYPDEPTPNDTCFAGSACTYAGGVGCTCRFVKWMCSGDAGCPATAPGTGIGCNELAGRLCDYPNPNPYLSIACVCSADAEAADATWACVQTASCPASQPSYPTVCPGLAGCRYGDVFCSCLDAGTTWICDWPFIIPPFITP